MVRILLRSTGTRNVIHRCSQFPQNLVEVGQRRYLAVLPYLIWRNGAQDQGRQLLAAGDVQGLRRVGARRLRRR